METIIERLGWFSEATSLPVAICSKKGTVEYSMPRHHEPAFSTGFALVCTLDYLFQEREAPSPLVYMLPPGYFLGLMRLRKDQIVVLGPVGLTRFSIDLVREDCAKLVDEDGLNDFCGLIMETPPCSLRKFAASLLTLMALIGSPITLNDIVFHVDNAVIYETELRMGSELFARREESSRHISKVFETDIFTAVERGDQLMLEKAMTSPMDGTPGRMSKNDLRQAKYLFISTVTGATRAAIRGGLSHEESCSLSDTYCQQMDELTSVYDIYMLCYKMLQDFTNRVAANRSNGQYSRHIRLCLDYISMNLHNPISISDLSSCCGLSTRTLSQRFPQEVGVSVPEYIRSKRLHEAQYLLTNTTYSLADIGNLLQFCSQSYFTKVFKETYGMTPQQYRNKATL